MQKFINVLKEHFDPFNSENIETIFYIILALDGQLPKNSAIYY